MSNSLCYDVSAAGGFLDQGHIAELGPRLLSARDEVLADVTLWKSGGPIPSEKQPLDAGFIELPEELLAENDSDPGGSLLGRIQQTSESLRQEIDRLVVLGIGGSYMGARALFEGLCHPYHNELPRELRGDVPRLYFEGNNLDNDTLQGLLQLLKSCCTKPDDLDGRWGVVVISKSGGTLETAAAFRIFREALETYYGPDSPSIRNYVVPITGDNGKLHDLAVADGYPAVFPIPDGVGGRFSVFSAVGLFPAAMLGLNVERLLEGAADMNRRFRQQPIGDNPVLDYTATCHLLERDHGATTRVLSTWGARLEAVGLWYDQLLAESLGKQERGATPLTVVNTRDLHSRGQQHQEGARDKLITNLWVREPATDPLQLPAVPAERNHDALNRHADKTVPTLLSAALNGTNTAYADARRPTADIILSRLDEYALGELLQMLMLATVVEGRLIGINPYGQPGVEAYKTNMTDILTGE